MEKANKPTHEIRIGAIKAAIWKNQTKVGVRYSVTVTRLYKDGEKWEQTNSFGRDDLLLAAKVLDLAHSWVFQQSESEPAEEKAA